MEVYVDDLVIKIHTEEELVRDIKETFKTLGRINMKLNPRSVPLALQKACFLDTLLNLMALSLAQRKRKLSSNFLHHAH